MNEAMRRTRRLCSTVIDTMGRELMVRGQWQTNDQVCGRRAGGEGVGRQAVRRSGGQGRGTALELGHGAHKHGPAAQKGDIAIPRADAQPSGQM